MIFMSHPEHGGMHVSDGYAEEHEKNGWKVTTHAEWRKEMAAAKNLEAGELSEENEAGASEVVVLSNVEASELAAKPAAKRGRKTKAK